MLKTLLGVAAFPFVAIAMFAAGLIGAVAHLLALPFLYLWERRQERRIIRMAPPVLQKPPQRTSSSLREGEVTTVL